MPRHTTLPVTQAAYVEMTNADVTNISLQVQRNPVLLSVSASVAAPADDLGAVELPSGAMLVNEALADLFPGFAGPVRVFARAVGEDAKVMVSHA